MIRKNPHEIRKKKTLIIIKTIITDGPMMGISGSASLMVIVGKLKEETFPPSP
jgi:hypothetical protein